jgi:hypothetical protein
MPRGVHGPDSELAYLHLVALAQRLEGVGVRCRGRQIVARAGARHDLAGSRDIVVVQVRLEDVRNAQSTPARGRHIVMDVAPGVEQGRLVAVGIADEIADVVQAGRC